MSLYYETIEKFFPYLIKNYSIEKHVNSLINEMFSKCFIDINDLEEIYKIKLTRKKMHRLSKKLLQGNKDNKMLYEVLVLELNKNRPDISHLLQQIQQEILTEQNQVKVDCYYETIRSKFSYLIDNFNTETEVVDLAVKCLSMEFIDLNDLEDITKTSLNEVKMTKLMHKLLTRKGILNYEYVFDVFVKQIRNSRADIADDLRDELEIMTIVHYEKCDRMESEEVMKHQETSLLKSMNKDCVIYKNNTECDSKKVKSRVKLIEEQQRGANHTTWDLRGRHSEGRIPHKQGNRTMIAELSKPRYSEAKPRYSEGDFPHMTDVPMLKKTARGNECLDLIEACRSKDSSLRGVKQTVKHIGVDINTADRDGSTALMVASSNGHVDIVEFLLEQPGIQVNAENNDGMTALMEACHETQPDVVQLLLCNREINVNATNKLGLTALMIAVSNVKTSNNENLDDSSMEPCIKCREKIVELLVNHKNIAINVIDDQGRTALIKSCLTNQAGIVKVLLCHRDVWINVKDIHGKIALIYACTQGHVKVVEELLKHEDTVVDESDTDGNTPLMVAASHGHDKIVELLNAKDIEVNTWPRPLKKRYAKKWNSHN